MKRPRHCRTENAGAYIPVSTPETGHVFVRLHSQKPARFPAEQKERSCIETLLFPVSRGRRYNTLDLAIPAIKRLHRSLASLCDCKQSLSLVRRCRTSCKFVCHETAGFFGLFRPRRALPPLDSPAKGRPALLWKPPQKSKTECAVS